MGTVAIPAGGDPPEPPLEPRQRDFLGLAVFVLAQQGYIERAGALAEALHALDDSTDSLLVLAVLRFLSSDWAGASALLEDLDRRAPVERFGSYRLDGRQRMRRYLKARCLYELRDTEGARDAVEVYLRHGEPG
ncbi:MAG: hypothetical protein INR70_23925 [Parafilimonas terrae]|nr:hypothetical protein [Parafilimonas terrae]